jgi:hypothetical protein
VRRRADRPFLRCFAAWWVCAATAAVPCAAQVEATLDASASLVKYDGYLAAGAASLTPSVAWQSSRAALAARGSFLAFETGRTSIQGLISAATFSPPVGAVRLEGAGEAGASVYAGFARFAHALGRARVHVFGHRVGAWAGPLMGRLSRGNGGEGARGASAGGWVRFPAGALEATWTRLIVGDTAFSDLLGRAHLRAGALDVAGSFGTRVASRGGGRGVYGDVTATVRLAEWVALLVGGGTYPSDPVRGSIPGRYLTAGVRLLPRAAPRAAEMQQIGVAPRGGPVGDAPRLDRARVSVERLDGLAVLVVRVSEASRVEVMGDFTEWQPVALAASGQGRYEYALALPPGMHRFNLRLDGGAWGVPLGAGFAADEFGGSVGVLIVP